MFAACCCAKGGNSIGDVIDESRIVQEMPKRDGLVMLEVPRAVEKNYVAPTRGAEATRGSFAEAVVAAKKEHGSASAPSLPGPQPGTTYTAVLVRNEEEAIGLDIDLIDGLSAVVVDIKDGAVKNWNAKNADAAIRVNDRIIVVNGENKDANSLVMKLKTDTTWAITVQRPVEFTVSISRADTPSLGMDLRYAPNGTTLMITQVGDGPMKVWNNQHPDKAVCKHDRIVQLNGVRGTPTQLLQASEDWETLNMVIIHYPQPPLL